MNNEKKISENELIYLTLFWDKNELINSIEKFLGINNINSEKDILILRKILGYSGKVNLEEKDLREN